MNTLYFTTEEWDTVYAACSNYAKKEFKSTELQRARRNQTNKSAILSQTTVGKIAEWAVTFFYSDKGYQMSAPDMKIYAAPNKSFDADLLMNGTPLHVKSQSIDSANRYGTSWTFQYGGKGTGHKDPLINRVDENVALCVVDMKQHMVIIHGIFNFKVLRKKLKEPKLDYLKKTKRCIYLTDLI